MNEEHIEAAKAAWRRDPDNTAKALLGLSAEELFIQAVRGCNQHAHVKGCEDYDGRSESDSKRLDELKKEIEESDARRESALAEGKKGRDKYKAEVAVNNALRKERNELTERQKTREAVAKSEDPEKAALHFLDSEKTKLRRKLDEAVSELQRIDKYMWEAQSEGGLSKEKVIETYGASLKKASEKVSAIDDQFKDMVARWEEQSRKLGSKK